MEGFVDHVIGIKIYFKNNVAHLKQGTDKKIVFLVDYS